MVNVRVESVAISHLGAVCRDDLDAGTLPLKLIQHRQRCEDFTAGRGQKLKRGRRPQILTDRASCPCGIRGQQAAIGRALDQQSDLARCMSGNIDQFQASITKEIMSRRNRTEAGTVKRIDQVKSLLDVSRKQIRQNRSFHSSNPPAISDRVPCPRRRDQFGIRKVEQSADVIRVEMRNDNPPDVTGRDAN